MTGRFSPPEPPIRAWVRCIFQDPEQRRESVRARPGSALPWIEFRYRDGGVDRETREAPCRSEKSFASQDDLVSKFHKLTRHMMPRTQRDGIVEAVPGIGHPDGVAGVIDLLRGNKVEKRAAS